MQRTRPNRSQSLAEQFSRSPAVRRSRKASAAIVQTVPTGSTLLNLAISDRADGGWRRGGMVNIVGDSHAGKTLLCLTLCAEVCRDPDLSKYEIYYDDAEVGALGTFDIRRLFGDRTVRAIKTAYQVPPYRSETMDDWHANMLRLTSARVPFVYILDSLDSLLSREEQILTEKIAQGKEQKKSEGMAERARKMSRILREVNGLLSKTNSLLVIVSQTRENIGVTFGSNKTRSGGRALDFYASHIVWLAYVGKIKTPSGVPIGRSVRIRSSKSRVTGKEREIEVQLYSEYGLDDIGSTIEWLASTGGMSRAGNKGYRLEIGGGELVGTKDELIEAIEIEDCVESLRAVAQVHWDKLEEEARMNRMPRYA